MTHYALELPDEELRNLNSGEVRGLISSWEDDKLSTIKVLEALDGYLQRKWTTPGYQGWKRKFQGNPVGAIKFAKRELYKALNKAD